MTVIKREGIMMCCPFSFKRFEQWGSQAYLQPKLNGERCRVIWDSEGKVSLHSSYNKEIVSVPHIYQELSDIEFVNTEKDGELYVPGMDLRMIQSIVSRTVNLHPNFQVMQLHLFDNVDNTVQHNRFDTFYSDADIFKDTNSIKIVETDLVTSNDEISKCLAQRMEAGYEGIVLRKVDGLYQRDLHSTQIMKLKPRKDDHYIIVGVQEEIDIYGNPKNALGSFQCERNSKPFSIGTGTLLTRANREFYWKNPPIGKVLHIKYQELTPNGIPYAPVACSIEEIV